MSRPTTHLPPVVRSVLVGWSPAVAFDRFTREFATWWPASTHSIGEKRVARVIFEPGAGGLIGEEHIGGRLFQWGRVTLWEPPRKVGFTWHPSRAPDAAQDVVVEFAAEAGGTRVTLTSTGWERWGKGAKIARRGYASGWGYILNVFAARRTAKMAVTDVMLRVAQGVQWLRGGLDAAIARAGGEIHPGGK